MSTFFKDPDALLDYTVDWTDWLDTDIIQTSTWTVDPALFTGTESATASTATVWLGNGIVGQRHSATNRIVTNLGRTDERTIMLVIQEK